VPVVVRLPEAFRSDLSAVAQLTLPGRSGPTRLDSIAGLSMESGPAQVNRYDRLRNVNITLELNSVPLGDVVAAVDRLPALASLPPGVTRATVGDAEVMGELFASFALAMLTGVLCIYVVLVLLFRDFFQPMTILAALPLSIGGAFVALLAAGSSFSMPSLIGLIMLMGVTTKNSILLVDYVIIARRDLGLGRTEAIVDACRKRARPIVMTTLAMGAGMLPIALGIGVDPSFRSPMAIAVLGGLVTGTLLSLLVIPVVYTLVDDLTRLPGRLLSRRHPRPTPSA
jgi:multidrug efflux pump subunit AcrB